MRSKWRSRVEEVVWLEGMMGMMDDSDRSWSASEWRAAQAITFTTPSLVTAAKQELNFLARVHQEPDLTRSGPTLDRAVCRYRKEAHSCRGLSIEL